MIIKKIVKIFWFTVLFCAISSLILSGPIFLAAAYFGMNPPSLLVNIIIFAIFIAIFVAFLAAYIAILKPILGNFKAQSEAIFQLPYEEQQKARAKDRIYLLWFLPFIILVLAVYGIAHYNRIKDQKFMESLDRYSNKDYGVSFDYCEDFGLGGKLENTNGRIYYINLVDSKDYDRRVSFDLFKKTDNNIKVYHDTFNAGLNKREHIIGGYAARSWEDGSGYSTTLIDKDDVFIDITSNSVEINDCYQSVLETLELSAKE